MTIPNTARKAGPLLGTGSQTAWPFTFKVFTQSDVAVSVTNALGVVTVLALGTDYTVTLNSNQDTSPGGTVNYPISGAALPVGSALAIIGDLDYDQALDLPSGGNFSPLALENQLDRATMQIQQLKELSDRSARMSVFSSPEDVEALTSGIIALAAVDEDIAALSGSAADIATVADSVGSVNTVANSIGAVNSVADNLSLWRDVTAGNDIQITNFNGTGSQTAFTLPFSPGVENNTQVFIGGVYQQKNTYSLSGTTLTFGVAPPSGTANIEVVWSRPFVLGATDAGLVSFVQSGAGAGVRTSQDKMRETVSVKDFGAVGDGVADDTAAIQTAINAAKSVHFPPGTYKITGSITLSQNIFEITGVKGKSILWGSGGGNISGYFRVMQQFYADFGTITGLTFDSDDATKTRWAIYSPSSVYISHWKIAECNFNGRLTGGIIANLIACHVYRCYFGVYFSGSGNDLKAIQSIGQVTPDVANTNINVIEQCEFAACGNPDSIVEFSTGYKLVFRDCIFEQLAPDFAVVLLSGIQYPVFEGCWFENAQGTTGAGKSVIWTRKDGNNLSCEVLTVDNCLFHTYATIPDGLVNFSDSIRKVAHFTKNFMVSLQSPVIVGGNSVATFVESFGNSATVGTGGDATGLQYNSPVKFDLGVDTTVVTSPAVKFPAVQVLSSDPNTLDDYEEGTWTPAVSGIAITNNTAAKYTKIGRVVTVQLDVTWPTTSNSGLAIITGLPFVSAQSSAAAIGYTTNSSNLYCLVGGSTIELLTPGLNLSNANLSANRLILEATYTV